jgi:hypothetical protein
VFRLPVQLQTSVNGQQFQNFREARYERRAVGGRNISLQTGLGWPRFDF